MCNLINKYIHTYIQYIHTYMQTYIHTYIDTCIYIHTLQRCNLLTRWNVSSIPANGIFLTNTKNRNAQRVEND